MSILKIMEASYFNKDTNKWEEYAPKTVAAAVETKDGGDVQGALDAVPGKISDAVAEVRGDAPAEGNTLGKLYETIETIRALLQADDPSLDTLQEIVDYIKKHGTDLDRIGTDKVDYDDIINNLNTVATVEYKVLDARQGKVLKDAIDKLKTDLAAFETQSEGYATKTELTVAVAAAMPVISETAPNNPASGQIWLRPIGTVEV